MPQLALFEIAIPRIRMTWQSRPKSSGRSPVMPRLQLAYPAARIPVPSPFGHSNTSMIATIAGRVFSFIAILVKSSGPKVCPRAND